MRWRSARAWARMAGGMFSSLGELGSRKRFLMTSRSSERGRVREGSGTLSEVVSLADVDWERDSLERAFPLGGVGGGGGKAQEPPQAAVVGIRKEMRLRAARADKSQRSSALIKGGRGGCLGSAYRLPGRGYPPARYRCRHHHWNFGLPDCHQP